MLRWTLIPTGKTQTAGICTEGLGGSFSINAHGKSLGSGHFADVEVSTLTGSSLYVIANMQDATQAIGDTFVLAFVLANPGMAAPQLHPPFLVAAKCANFGIHEKKNRRAAFRPWIELRSPRR
jgi:hypothetical protein